MTATSADMASSAVTNTLSRSDAYSSDDVRRSMFATCLEETRLGEKVELVLAAPRRRHGRHHAAIVHQLSVGHTRGAKVRQQWTIE